jgi:CRISPR-associated protein Csx10
MRRIPLLITLKDDLVISANAATSGAHTSLDYIPGSLLLGAVAAKLYKSLSSPEEKWQVFYSGKVCFQNGYIVHKDNRPSYPSPLCLHHFKGEEPKNGGDTDISLFEQNIIRPNIDDLDNNKQPKQLREAYITGRGHLATVIRTASMKTAIDNTNGRAAESQLFGYQAIQSRQRFLAHIDIASDVPKDLVDHILDALEGQARMGRSRSAQYGRVTIERLKSEAYQPTSMAKVGDTDLTIWCLSDLALTDPITGQPTLTPRPEHFGLSQGELNLSHSFLRSRAYSPYNAFRKAFDSQRQVISQGSVITFDGIAPLTAEQIKHLESPIGSYTEVGAGHIAIQAKVCVSSSLKAAIQDSFTLPVINNEKTIDSPLIKWLRVQQKTQAVDHQAWLNTMLADIQKIYKTARQLNALEPSIPIGPSASQWGVVYQAARDNRRHPEKLLEQLFLDPKHAICRQKEGSQHTWGLKIDSKNTFSTWLADQLIELAETSNDKTQSDSKRQKESHIPHTLSDKVALLAAEMRSPRGEKISTAGEDN